MFFIILVTFGVLNVLIAVIVDATMEASHVMKQENLQDAMEQRLTVLDKLREVIFMLDTNHTGNTTLDKMKEVYHTQDFQRFLLHVEGILEGLKAGLKAGLKRGLTPEGNKPPQG